MLSHSRMDVQLMNMCTLRLPTIKPQLTVLQRQMSPKKKNPSPYAIQVRSINQSLVNYCLSVLRSMDGHVMFSSVTFSDGPTADDWERMKPEITDIWLHQARDKRELVSILRCRYKYKFTWVPFSFLGNTCEANF